MVILFGIHTIMVIIAVIMEMMVISKVNYNRFNGKFGRNAVILAVYMSIMCINSNICHEYGHIFWE